MIYQFRTPEEDSDYETNLILARILESERVSFAGQSTVSIQRTDGNLTKVVKPHAYQEDIGTAMTISFDRKLYTGSEIERRQGTGPKITLYGLAVYTVAAAMAFDTTINLVEKWCMRRTGGARKSYVRGIADELHARWEWRMPLPKPSEHRKQSVLRRSIETRRKRLIERTNLTGWVCYRRMASLWVLNLVQLSQIRRAIRR